MRVKKYITVLMVLSMAIAILTSCKRVEDPYFSSSPHDTSLKDVKMIDTPIEYNVTNVTSQLKYSDGYLYFYVGTSYGRNSSKMTLYRYNIQTAAITTVCPDPLCQHSDKGCPFYALDSQYAVYNDTIIYDRLFWLHNDIEDGEIYYESVKYDVINNKLTTFSKVAGYKDALYSIELYIDDYRFFYDLVRDEETQKAYYALCRMNLDDGKITVVSEKASEEGLTIASQMLFAVDGKLFFSDGKEIFYTDLDLKGKQTVMSGNFNTTCIFTDGEYMYWGDKETDNSNLMTLYRAKLDGSGKKSLNIQTYNFTLTENYIYYKNTEQFSLGEDKRSQSSGGELRYRGTALCRAAHDGSGQEEVFSYWQGDTFYIPSSPPIYVDNKIYTLYSTYTDADHDGAIRDDEYFQSSDGEHYNILCVDLTTGEMDYIYCGTEPQTTP